MPTKQSLWQPLWKTQSAQYISIEESREIHLLANLARLDRKDIETFISIDGKKGLRIKVRRKKFEDTGTPYKYFFFQDIEMINGLLYLKMPIEKVTQFGMKHTVKDECVMLDKTDFATHIRKKIYPTVKLFKVADKYL